MIEKIFSNKKNAIIFSLLISLVVMVMKFWAYFITKSNAILTDASESIVNIIAASFAYYSIYLSGKPKDEDHPYGHGKIEFFSSGLEGLLIIFAAILTVIPAIKSLINESVKIDDIKSGILITFIVILINGFTGYFLVKYGKKLKSIVLEADGKHLFVDSISSIILLTGLVIVNFTGFKIIDPIIAVCLAIYIFYNGLMILSKSVSGLMDETDYELLNMVISILKKHRKNEWIDIHNFRVKKYGAELHIDGHLTLPYYLSLKESHEIVSHFENTISKHMDQSVELFIHSDPCVFECCNYCRVMDCKKRLFKFEKDIDWTAETFIRNQKHFNY
jgi:cation diffusion facilitator family transporter